MKNIKWSSIIIAVCYIAIGVLFFADANLTKDAICAWMGYGLLIVGALYIVSYFFKPKNESFYNNDFRDGLIIITIGILPLAKKDVFLGFVYLAIAIIIMVSGYNKLQDCVNAWRLGLKYGLLYFVLASISIVLGLVIIMNGDMTTKQLHNLIGASLMFSGASDLISTLFLSRKMQKYNDIIEKQKVEEPKEEIVEENNTPEV